MKKNNLKNRVAALVSFSVVLLTIISFLLTGCGFPVKIRGIFEPRVEFREVSIDTSNLFQEDQALKIVIRSLNATKYGILLRATSNYGNKVFEYDEIYVRLQEKITRYLRRRQVLYVVEITSDCAEPESAEDMLRAYSKEFFYGSEKAKKIVAALVSLGAKPCSPLSVEQQ